MSSVSVPAVIFGLGNPGPKHAADRHNAGFWLVDRLAAAAGQRFREETKLSGSLCQVTLGGKTVRLVKPGTFMNRSGHCVRRVTDYYRSDTSDVLVAHDEVDLPAGVARLKSGGGHGGHNGLRDIIASCGADFLRLRLGVGHPGHKDLVVDYVLHAPGGDEQSLIDDAITESVSALDVWFKRGFQHAMTCLHTATAGAGCRDSPRIAAEAAPTASERVAETRDDAVVVLGARFRRPVVEGVVERELDEEIGDHFLPQREIQVRSQPAALGQAGYSVSEVFRLVFGVSKVKNS